MCELPAALLSSIFHVLGGVVVIAALFQRFLPISALLALLVAFVVFSVAAALKNLSLLLSLNCFADLALLQLSGKATMVLFVSSFCQGFLQALIPAVGLLAALLFARWVSLLILGPQRRGAAALEKILFLLLALAFFCQADLIASVFDIRQGESSAEQILSLLLLSGKLAFLVAVVALSPLLLMSMLFDLLSLLLQRFSGSLISLSSLAALRSLFILLTLMLSYFIWSAAFRPLLELTSADDLQGGSFVLERVLVEEAARSYV